MFAFCMMWEVGLGTHDDGTSKCPASCRGALAWNVPPARGARGPGPGRKEPFLQTTLLHVSGATRVSGWPALALSIHPAHFLVTKFGAEGCGAVMLVTGGTDQFRIGSHQNVLY